MLVLRSLAVAAALAAVATVPTTDAANATTTTKLQLTGWYPCSAVTFAKADAAEAAAAEGSEAAAGSAASAAAAAADGPEAQCALFKAPLCHKDVCTDAKNKEIDVFVKRITSPVEGKPNVFLLQGGPGAGSTAMESAMVSLYGLLEGNVNVYTMDHRGTGRSTKLDCIAAQALMSGSPGGGNIDLSEVAGCADELEKLYGSDLSSFSVTSAASDLKYFISNYLTDSKTFVYAVSYGTALVERLMHLNTTEIAGYVLDGIATTSGSTVENFETYSIWDPAYNSIGEYFASLCEKHDDECGQYFKGTTLLASIKKLVAEIDDKSFVCHEFADKAFAAVSGAPVGQTPPSHNVRMLFGQLIADASTRNFIPVLTHRLLRCNADDQEVLTHFLEKQYSQPTTGESDWFWSDLLYKIIIYSEFWESPAPSFEMQTERFLNTTMSNGFQSETGTYCAFTKDQTKSCDDFKNYTSYNASPIAYKKDKYWNIAASPPKDVSVLLMSSKMDPQTPHKFAEIFLDVLKTDNKELVTFETATHGTIWTTPLSSDPDAEICGMLILASYVKNDGKLKSLDKSCVAKMPALSYKLDETLRADFLNATEPFNGKFEGQAATGGAASSGEKNTSYKTVFIVFTVLFVLAAIVAIVLAIKLRRSKAVSTTEAPKTPAYTEERA